jgi:hypothetical protein
MRLSPPNFLRSNPRQHHLVPSAIHWHHLQEKPIHLWLSQQLTPLAVREKLYRRFKEIYGRSATDFASGAFTTFQKIQTAKSGSSPKPTAA